MMAPGQSGILLRISPYHPHRAPEVLQTIRGKNILKKLSQETILFGYFFLKNSVLMCPVRLNQAIPNAFV